MAKIHVMADSLVANTSSVTGAALFAQSAAASRHRIVAQAGMALSGLQTLWLVAGTIRRVVRLTTEGRAPATS